MHTLKERTFANADGTAVAEEGSVEARYFVGNAGDEIPLAEAQKLGLVGEETEEPEAEAEAEPEPPAQPKRRGRKPKGA